MTRAAEIEDIYRLSPVQQAILFYSLYAPATGAYFEQFHFALQDLDPAVFGRAWDEVVRHTPTLRTSFLWGESEEPMQVVHRRVALPVEAHDLRGLAAAERERRLEDLLAADRRRGFDLASPPLLRLLLVRLDEAAYEAVWSYHHLLLDGWSAALVLKEVTELYATLRRGGPAIPPRRRPFRDYIGWLRRQDPADAEAYFRRRLAGVAGPTSLAIDRGRERSASGLDGWSRRELRLAPPTVAALRAAARRGRLTVNTLVQAGWALVLGLYSGEQSVVFGATVSGRPAELAGVESMIGCFINTLPVRLELAAEAEVLPWLADLQADQVALRRHELISLQQIRGALGLPGDLPLFESIVVFENFDLDAAAGRAKVRRFQRTNFPLALVVEPDGEDLWLHLTHDASRFDGIDAERLLRSFATALDALAAVTTGARLGNLALLTAAERQQAAREWNDTAVGFDGRGSLPARLAARAALAPRAEAVRCGGERLSYGKLAASVERAARRLRAVGVGPEVLVAVSVERSPALLIALLGVLAAGGAYVPLDPSYPEERLRWMLADSRAAVVVCGRDLAGRFAAGEARIVVVEDLLDEAAAAVGSGATGGEPAGSRGAEIQPQHLAYVIYTSGSTGRPKGVAVSHRALLNFLESMRRRPGLAAGDVLVAVTSPSFDIAALELYLPLLVGARVAIASRDEAADGRRLRALLESSAATVLQATPATWRLLLEAEWRGAPGFRALCGGEALPPAMAAALCGRAASVWNLYGPTETAVWSTVREVAPGGEITVGRPIANTRLVILDRDFAPVPAGVPGELAIGGRGLARGYWGRPELTAERFLPDPSAGAEAGARVYRTGDLAKWRRDGEVEWLGRLDHQVKVRGFRIELGEIEAALERSADVEQAVVVARGEGESRALVAYVVGAGAREPERLRAALRESLPEVMVPARIVELARVPLTPNGKVDRKALPTGEEGEERTQQAPPRGPIEEVLYDIWSEVLRRAGVGRDESFFELGGHSLLAMRVVSRVRTALEVELPLADLFAAPTVAALARRVEHARQAGSPRAAPPLVRSPGQAEMPLSFAQERFWFLDRLQPDSAAYNIPAAVRLEGTLHAPAFGRAFAAVARRHETLRTRFPLLAGLPVAVATDEVPDLPRVDLAGLADAPRAAEARRLAAAHIERPFDLAAGPPARAVLIRVAPTEHVAVLSLHHIVADGWSMGILVRELAALYAAEVAGRPSRPPEANLRYADFAVWQHAWLRGEVLAAELAFWRQALAGAPDLLELPTDRPRPAVARHRGGRLALDLPPALSRELAAAVRRRGATLFMGLLAGFDALLARITGQGDLVVGSPIAGRTQTELEGLIGPFVNTLALRAEGVADLGFDALLGQVKRTTLAAYAHQELPFEKLVEELSPRRTQSHAPVFQVLLALQPPAEPLSLPGLRLAPVAIATDAARFDLALDLAATAAGVVGSWSYDRDLLDAATVARSSRRFAALLGAALASPERPIAELPLLAAAEREELAAWNRTAREIPWAGTVAERIGEQMAARPDSVAIACGVESLTYGELGRRANRLGRHLRGLGIGPEALVGICLERSPQMAVALLATWQAGSAYVPLDPSYPPQRIATIVADSRLVVLITDRRSAAALPATAAPARVLLDESLPAAGGAGEAAASAGPESLAYVIYTSGSTGRPKGVAIRQGGLRSFLGSMAETPGSTAADRWLATTTISFDIAALELYLPLCVGARIELASRQTATDGTLLAGLLAASGATVLQATPATWRQLLAAGWKGDGRLKALCGGEALPRDLGRALLERVGSLWNVYGPTETTIWSSILRVTAAEVEPEAAGPVAIGSPIANTALQILDRGGEPLPAGVAGELYVGGAGLARGYLGSPEQTAAAFVPDALSGEPGARLYRTGDLARRRADGCLEFIGRADHQLKVRGYRIEAGEVEAALVELGGARQAVAMARLGSAGEAELVAYVVPGREVRAGALRQALRTRLPEHMVPSTIVLLAELPLTPNGKVDRRALPAPGRERPAGAEEYLAPRTPVEELLVAIWEEVLGREPVGVIESFFDLGGHSLLATRVAVRIEEALGVELPLRVLFEAPTVEALAREIAARRARPAAGSAAAPPLVAAGPHERLPLSFAQERLWFLDQLEPGSATYNLPVALHFSGRLDPRLLAAALSEVAGRHQALRTVVQVESGSTWQRVLPPGPVVLHRIDLSALSGDRARREARQVMRQEARRPFVLTAGPLLRGAWVKAGAADGLLLLTLHHIVGDGASLGILVREMLALYEAERTGRPAELAALALQYGDYAFWQRGWLTGGVLDDHLAYWRRQLAGPPLLTLSGDRPRPPVQSFRGAQRQLAWPAEMARSLAALARREGATLYMTLLAAFEVLILRHAAPAGSPGEAVGVATPVAGRSRRELEELIGLFVNTLVLRTDLSGRPTFREVLRRVRETVLAAHAHQDLPFERLVDALQPERSLGRSPLAQYSFALQEAAASSRLPGLEWRQLAPATATAKFDLSCINVPGSQGLTTVFEYAVDLFDDSTVARLLAHLEILARGALEAPDREVRELPLLPAGEWHQVAREWSGFSVRRAFSPVHRQLAEQARRRPEAIALVHEDAALSYGELARRADRLARRLRALGVGAERVVAVCLERGIETVVAALAVLGSGGVYLPLDPGYPRQRLEFLLADSRARVLITGRGSTPTPDVPAAVRVIHWDDRSAISSVDAPEESVGPVGEDDLAYLIYTSGTSGRPKAVMATHGNLASTLAACQSRFAFDAGDVIPHLASFSFDISLFELLAPLLAGGTSVLLGRDAALDMAELGRRLDGCTRLHMLPALMRRLLEWLRVADGGRAPRLPAMRTVFVGGDRVPAELLAEIREAFPAAAKVVLYGPTEGSIVCAFHAIGDRLVSGSVLGRPFDGALVTVADSEGRPAPIGAPGEVCIGGSGVTRGYLARPELTAERYAPDALGRGGAGARLYRTGDLARQRPDGRLEFLGRLDQQVKVRGHRIEPAEIEAALAEEPRIRDAVVVARHDGAAADEPRLVAYLATVPGEPPTVVELRRLLAERLPEHAIPSAYVFLAELPLTVHGKVDRESLPAPDAGGPEPPAGTVEPSGPVEERLAAIWCQLLGRRHVGADENFFDLGGDSILCIQMVARARAVGIELTPKQVFRHRTVGELAAVAGIAAAAPLELEDAAGDVPLTPVQRAFFAAEPVDPHHFNQALLLATAPALDAVHLVKAASAVVAHHDALRFRFARQAIGWRQSHAGTGAAAPSFAIDLAALPSSRQLDAIGAVGAELQASLDLAAGPLARCAAFNLGPGRHGRLLLVIHHLVVDGVSWRILLEDLERGCRQALRGEPVHLPAKTASFKRWAERLTAHARSPEIEAELAYWREVAARSALHAIPVDFPRGTNRTGPVGLVALSLEADETRRLLAEAPTLHRAQIDEVLLTALARAFAAWSGERSLWVDVERHGREEMFDGLDVSRTVGWFTAVSPVCLDLGGAADLQIELARVKDGLRAVPGRGIGYGLLRHLHDAPETAAAMRVVPRPQVSFNYLGQLDRVVPEDALFTLATERTGPTESPLADRQYLVEVGAAIRGGCLHLYWRYGRHLHRRETIERWADATLAGLRELLTDATGSYAASDFPLLGLGRDELENAFLEVDFDDGAR